MFKFLKEVQGELTKVVWPSRKDTIRYTLIVIVFSVSIAVLLGAADYGFLKGFEALFNK